ncbi:MAG: MFS transporter [Polyangiaceae bacterium]
MSSLPGWAQELLPIVLLLIVVVMVVSRLPKVDVGHTPAYRKRRVQNWLPVGLTYAFLYMARYNLNASVGVLFDKAQFSKIYFWGTLAYGISFVINGPITDRFGGKKTIITAAVGSALANLLMAAATKRPGAASVPVFACLYALNMYFQSFGAVAIVKLNSAWFHLRERGTFGGIFGILISLGLYFAFDWSTFIQKHVGVAATFMIPAAILGFFTVLNVLLVKDSPSEAGHLDFDLGDATEAIVVEKGAPPPPRPSVFSVAAKMFTTRAILIIMLIEFCSGYLRNSIMQYYKPFAKDLGRTSDFVLNHWGMLNCIAGILGGMFAGVISDKFFDSRRGPVSAVLYSFMIVGSVLMFFTMQTPLVGWVVVFMTLAIIGVHGMLSGTASMDFGGRNNTGVAVGIIDGFVYLGTAAEALVLGHVLPAKEAAKDVANWWTWPAAILPFAVIGFCLALLVWNAKPGSKKAAAH